MPCLTFSNPQTSQQLKSRLTAPIANGYGWRDRASMLSITLLPLVALSEGFLMRLVFPRPWSFFPSPPSPANRHPSTLERISHVPSNPGHSNTTVAGKSLVNSCITRPLCPFKTMKKWRRNCSTRAHYVSLGRLGAGCQAVEQLALLGVSLVDGRWRITEQRCPLCHAILRVSHHRQSGRSVAPRLSRKYVHKPPKYLHRPSSHP